jgi:hypothetical protein
MSFILLNKVYCSTSNQKPSYNKKINIDKVKEQVKRLEDRKKNNVNESVSLIKEFGQRAQEIGKKDISFISSIHDCFVEHVKTGTPESKNFVVFDIFESLDDDTFMSSEDISPKTEEEDVFDN